jgi:hypothetical protein
LEVALPGFRTFVQTGIVLQVNSNPVINALLQVGQVSEQVEVQANAGLVETRNAGIGQVIENERILELPLNGRQVTDLIVLAGAAVQTATASSRGMQGGAGITVAGGTSFSVSYSLDGASHNNPFDNYNLPLPFPDALQEFKVETSALTAQNGMHSGAWVNAVTKSGTNEFHGSAFEFVRNGIFNARNFFATKRDSLKRNQFGGTLGGPVVHNKLFVFGGFQGTTTRSDPPDTISFVPTPAMLAGDFTTVTSPACRAAGQLNLRTPFVNNRVNAALFSRAAVNIAARLPRTEDPCGRIVYGLRDAPNETQSVGKVDYQLSIDHSIFGRYMATTYRVLPPYHYTDNVLTTTRGGRDNLAQSITLGDTYLFGSDMVNAFRLAVNRSAIHRTHKEFFEPADVGINSYSYIPDYMLMTVTGGFALGGGTELDSTFYTTTYLAAEDLSWVRGTHQIGIGASVAYWRSNQVGNARAPGNFTINGQVTGLGLADFLLGYTSDFIEGLNLINLDQTYFGLYAQDTWTASPRVTLNYGLRWEPYLPHSLRDGNIYNFDYDRFRQGIKSTVFPNAPAGFRWAGDPDFIGKTGIHKKWSNVAPRVGLAWDPRGDGQTSIRASYGIAFDFPNSQIRLDSVGAAPFGYQLRLTSPAGGLDDPWRDYPGGNPFPTPYPPKANTVFTPFGSYLGQDEHTEATSVQSWNLSLQRQMGTDWLVSASYLGSHTTHLWTMQATNPPVYFPGGPCEIHGVTYNPCSSTANISQRRKLYLERPQDGQYVGLLDRFASDGSASYHGLLVGAQRRATEGVTISGNYTWSHCISDPTVGGGTGAIGTVYVDPNNRVFDRGNCEGDRRHLVSFTTVAETPQFSNATLRALATAWRLSGIYRWSSGQPLTIISGQDRALSSIGGQRAHQILENPFGDKSLNAYLNPAAFAQPALGTLGNLGRANIQGPNSWQLDVALSRAFQFGESQRLELRAEAFNVTNSLRKGLPAVNLSQNIFGQITTAADPRIVQFALKYVF